MSDSIIKQLAQDAGATDVINGSWLAAFADAMGVSAPVNGSWWQAIGEDLGLSAVNGSWIQAIAEHYGATAPVNGSWLQALLDNISFVTLPVNTVAPAISGTAEVGQTLTCSTGTWSGSPTYAYQWKRNGSNIGGATNSTYTLVTADAGTSVKCTVTATNGAGSASADSNTVSPTFETDAQAFITAASITDPTQQSAVNQLVIDLKGYSLWSKMKAVYPFVGGSAASHKWNLKDPRDLDAAFRLSFSGGWTHASTGITGNGTNTFANTFLRLNDLQRNSSHASVYVGTDSTGNYSELGAYNPAPVWSSLYAKVSGNFSARINTDGSSLSVANSDARGFYVVTRPDSNTIKTVKDNGSINSSSIPSVDNSSSTRTYFLGDTNFDGGPLGYYTNRRMSFVSFGDGLSDTDLTNLYTAVQAFQTTLGRSIGTQTVSDSDAQAFVNAAGIVDQVEADAVNQLVIDLKGYSLWSKMKRLYPMVGGTPDKHKYDLISATAGTFYGGWTHSSTGSKGNGSTGYFDTGFNASASLSQNSTSHGIYNRTSVPNEGYHGTQPPQFFMIGYYPPSTLIDVWQNNGSPSMTWSSNAQGFISATRRGTNDSELYFNGVSRATSATASTSIPSNNYYLGAINNGGTAGLYSTMEIALYYIGDGMTDTDNANLYTAIQTFQTTIGRQV